MNCQSYQGYRALVGNTRRSRRRAKACVVLKLPAPGAEEGMHCSSFLNCEKQLTLEVISGMEVITYNL